MLPLDGICIFFAVYMQTRRGFTANWWQSQDCHLRGPGCELQNWRASNTISLFPRRVNTHLPKGTEPVLSARSPFSFSATYSQSVCACVCVCVCVHESRELTKKTGADYYENSALKWESWDCSLLSTLILNPMTLDPVSTHRGFCHHPPSTFCSPSGMGLAAATPCLPSRILF